MKVCKLSKTKTKTKTVNRVYFQIFIFLLGWMSFEAFAENHITSERGLVFKEQNKLSKIYEIGHDFVNRYHWPIIKAQNPDRFLGFRYGVDDGMHRCGIPEYFHGDIGFSRLINELNNFSQVVSNQDYRQNSDVRDSVIVSAIGLVVLLERAGFHHVERNEALDKMRETIHLRNYFSLMANEGKSKNPARFMWGYLSSRFFEFPLDLITSGINELWSMKTARESDEDEAKSIAKFIMGYATFGLERGNDNLMIWGRDRKIRESMPLRLIHSILENVDGSDEFLSLELWALQEKYKINREFRASDKANKIHKRLMEIYKKQELPIREKIKIFLSDFLSSHWIAVIFVFGSVLVVFKPLRLAIRSRQKSIFFRSVWNIFRGRRNSFLQQLGVILIVFTVSLFLENIKKYEVPLETFKLLSE